MVERYPEYREYARKTRACCRTRSEVADGPVSSGREESLKPKTLYLLLCVAGTLLPLSQLMPFVRDHGLDLRLFFEQLFSTRIGAFFGWDVIVSSVVLWVFVLVDGRRSGVRNLWAPIAANLAVGVSLGLPLFLYMRERRVEAATAV